MFSLDIVLLLLVVEVTLPTVTAKFSTLFKKSSPSDDDNVSYHNKFVNTYVL